MKKTKRYEDGGLTEGPNANIDDDTRARALAWLNRGGEESSPEEEIKPKRTVKKQAKKADKSAQRRFAEPVSESLDEGSSMRRPSMTAPIVRDAEEAVRSNGFRGASGVTAGDVRDRGLRSLRGGTSVPAMKKGGVVKAKPKASSASRRADGIASKGKTKGRMV